MRSSLPLVSCARYQRSTSSGARPFTCARSGAPDSRCCQQQQQQVPPAQQPQPRPQQGTAGSCSRRSALQRGVLLAGAAAAAVVIAPTPNASLALGGSTGTLPPFSWGTAAAHAAQVAGEEATGSTTTATGPLDSGSSSSATEVTSRVWLDLGMCAEGARQDRALGDKSILCAEPVPLGRVLIGLYGNVAPDTVANFLQLVRTGSLQGTTFHKVFPGEYIKAGRQGSHRSGAVEPPEGLLPNRDVLSSQAFRMSHDRPGTVSLALTQNDDDLYLREKRGYRPLQFMITTGPGPVPSLDGENIVFGRVLQGMDAVAAATQVPTFGPTGQSRAYNQFASMLGDDRAARARATWGLPIKAVVIVATGEEQAT